MKDIEHKQKQVIHNKTFVASDVAKVRCIDLGKLDAKTVIQNPLAFLQDSVRSHGDCFRYQTSIGRLMVFNHPQHVKEVLHNKHLERTTMTRFILGRSLLTTAGPLWRHRRTLMQPFFLKAKVQSFVTVISTSIEAIVERWQAKAIAGGTVDINEEMKRLALQVMFGAICSNSLTNEKSDSFNEALGLLLTDLGEFQSAATGAQPMICPERNQRVKKAMSVIDQFINDILSTRKRDASPPDDLLTHLINEKNEEGRQMSDQELRNEIASLFLAGHETTAIVLSWAWYLLSLHSDVETQLHHEVDEVIHGSTPTLADVSRLGLTKQILQETMRLYPPIWILVRHAKQDTEIGNIKVSAGDSALVCPFVVHRHPDFWDNPNSFCPKRFSTELNPRQQDAYLPFGHGNHLCIGMHLATLEQTMVLAALVRRFRVRLFAGHEIKPSAGTTLRMQSDFPAKIELRHSEQNVARAGRTSLMNYQNT